MTVKRRLVAGLATCLLSIGAGALAATTPAQAALGNCPILGFKAFCLYSDVAYQSPVTYVWGDTARNTCISVADDGVTNSVWNATGTRWYLFHTTTCNGSHAEIAPNSAGRLPAGYDKGSTHGVMRTSTTS
jgi:peptidase inhibitor family I36